MARGATIIFVGVLISLWVAWPAQAEGDLSMRHVDCSRLARLPAMRLVIRDMDMLTRLGVADLVEIDFAKEMGLFVSLGPGKENLEAIRVKAVRQADGKIVVDTEELGFQDLLAAKDTSGLSAYQLVIVPKSTVPVEGFVERIEPCEGLCATSTLVAVRRDISYKGFKDRGEARGYKVCREGNENPIINRMGGLESVAWDVGPAGDPTGMRVRFLSTRSGGGAQCWFEYDRARYAPPPKERLAAMSHRERQALKAPADEKKIRDGIMAAYKVYEPTAKTATMQVMYGYANKAGMDAGRTDIAAIREPELNAESFRTFAQSDGKTYVTTDGNFIDAIDEIGKRGSLRWHKTYYKAEQDVDGLGHAILAYSELKLFQIRIKNVRTTDIDELRKQTKTLARRLGIRFDDSALDAMQFTFSVMH